jgi:hypothetical protein
MEHDVWALVNGQRVKGILTNEAHQIGPGQTLISRDAGPHARFELLIDGKIVPRPWHILDIIEED